MKYNNVKEKNDKNKSLGQRNVSKGKEDIKEED